MADPNAALYATFLPPVSRSMAEANERVAPYWKPPSRTPPAGIQRALNDYALQLLDVIEKEYRSQIRAWQGAFKEITAAFATAVYNRDTTLGEAEAQRAREAAVEAFIFGLLTAGAMRFLGAYVQVSVVPAIKTEQVVQQFPDVQALQFLTETQTVERFSKLQAAAFGGIVQDVGNRTLPALAGTSAFPKPKAATNRLDSWSGVINLQTDLEKFLGDSSDAVLGQFLEVEKWLIRDTGFGDAWAATANDNADVARVWIYKHFDRLRQEWAKQWEFFGTTPTVPSRGGLAKQFERALWATYILRVYDEEAQADMRKIHVHGKDALYQKVTTVLEEAISDRLRELNVAIAATNTAFYEQRDRYTGEGEPYPSVAIVGKVDEVTEAFALVHWAEDYLKTVQVNTARQFIPPARQRVLQPLLR
jgi:hypothetical protein